jgi:DNA ligase (NAD+)
MSKIEKIQGLVYQLNTYRNEYYNLNKPSVSDTTYDKLCDELTNLENETGYILSNSPTQTVGYEVKGKLQKVEHPIPLKSLAKTKSVDELIKWTGNKIILLMLKADGLTVELLYENGVLQQASTRGNSIIGEDILHNAKVFKNIPLTIPFKGLLRIAGEAIIHWDDFNTINSKLSDDDKYATPRNLAAGSVRQLDSKICSQREVNFYAFGILECSEELSDSKKEQFKWLVEQGFWSIYYVYGNPGDDFELYINRMKEVAEDKNIPIDGMVLTFDSVKYSKSLGETSHHPLHSIAWKAKDEAETTILRGIEWSVGRTGVITPVALFDTVLLDNTEVSRASLHNLSICEDLEIGFGDSISIIKANMIIPQVEENFTRSNNLIIPEVCPVCGGATIIDQDNESKFLYCTNEYCSAKIIKKFSHFVSRNAMNIDGLSDASLEKFIDAGFLNNFADIYKLSQYKSQIVSMDGFGLKSYNNLIKSIEKSKDVKLENFLYSLGIDQLGQGGSKRLVKHFNNNFSAIICASVNDLMQVEDFGEVTANSVYSYFDNDNNQDLVDELQMYINIKEVAEKKDVGFKSLDGLTFVVTGNVETFKNRKELEELITSLNGKLSGSVSSKTNYLINNDTTSTSGKNKKAKELNVPIISEQMFNEMIGR